MAAGIRRNSAAVSGCEYAIVIGSGLGGGHEAQNPPCGGGSIATNHQNAATARASALTTRRMGPPASQAVTVPNTTAMVARSELRPEEQEQLADLVAAIDVVIRKRIDAV